MTENTINSKTPFQDLTIGGNIYTAGNAKEFKTGDWRSIRPEYISDKCKQCGLCFPVCPDDAIPVENGNRKDFDSDAIDSTIRGNIGTEAYVQCYEEIKEYEKLEDAIRRVFSRKGDAVVEANIKALAIGREAQ